jgi:hypothetical protein
MNQALVEIRGISKKFPGVAALRDVSFTISSMRYLEEFFNRQPVVKFRIFLKDGH